jgi:hypothetical protein
LFALRHDALRAPDDHEAPTMSIPKRLSLLSRRPPLRAAAAVLVLSAASVTPAAAEALVYNWRLQGVAGVLAGIMLPNNGRGELRTTQENGKRTTELEITSPQSERGEYFLYGAESNADGSAAVAWSSYRWRDEEKSKRERVEVAGVVDVASGIQRIREQQPQREMAMRIWSDGKVYPVVVRRVGSENVTVPAGRYQTDHYRVRGVKRDGERFWKGHLDVWLARDQQATPVRIQVERGLANVRLELVPGG